MSESVIEWKRKEESYLVWDLFSKWFKIIQRHREREMIPLLLGRECKEPHITELGWNEPSWSGCPEWCWVSWSALASHYPRAMCTCKNPWEDQWIRLIRVWERMEENIYKARLKVLKIFVSSKEQQSKKMIIVHK